MNRSLILKISFAVSLLCLLSGLVFKILHFPLSEEVVIISLLAALVFIIIALPEVWSSGTIHKSEKIMWTAGFLVMLGLAGILYLVNGRKRVLMSRRSI